VFLDGEQLEVARRPAVWQIDLEQDERPAAGRHGEGLSTPVGFAVRTRPPAREQHGALLGEAVDLDVPVVAHDHGEVRPPAADLPPRWRPDADGTGFQRRRRVASSPRMAEREADARDRVVVARTAWVERASSFGPNEERVHAGRVTAHQLEAVPSGQPGERAQARAVPRRLVPLAVRLVGLHPPTGAGQRVVLRHDRVRPTGGEDGGEDVEVVAVDVDHEERGVRRRARGIQEGARVLRGGQRRQDGDSLAAGLAGQRRLLGIGLDPDRVPSVLDQGARAVLGTVARTDLDDRPVARSEAAKDLGDDAVLAVLGEAPVLERLEVRWACGSSPLPSVAVEPPEEPERPVGSERAPEHGAPGRRRGPGPPGQPGR
jgi:hypothetical protein